MFYKLTIYNARAHPLFYSLNLLFGDVLVSIAITGLGCFTYPSCTQSKFSEFSLIEATT